jgi:hypothetical protein
MILVITALLRGRRSVQVSVILKWFNEDFGTTPQEGLAGPARFIPNDAARRLVEGGGFSVRYLDYDWNLNDRRLASQGAGRKN